MILVTSPLTYAEKNKRVLGSYHSGNFGSISRETLNAVTEGGKLEAVKNAEEQCHSKVRQLTLFKSIINSGQYGINTRVEVSANFECIQSNESDLLMTDSKGFLLPEIAALKADPIYKKGTLRHFVSFKFKEGTSVEKIEEVKSKFLALQKLCVRSESRYILSIEAGEANSFEGVDQGKQIGFLVTFKSEGNRNYYVGQPLISPEQTAFYDPAHLAFKQFVGPLLQEPVANEGVFVFDYQVSH